LAELTELGDREIEGQKRSNSNAAGFHEAYGPHRRHLTELVMASAPAALPSHEAPRLCVLGAGNCGDLDLERLATRYGSIHLIDVDEQAIARAVARQAPSTRATLVTPAPIDLSGLLASLERWRDVLVTPAEVLAHPERASALIASRLDGPFDVVLSACVLSQMHFSVRNALSETHRLFPAANYTLTLTHLRTLARLAKPGGRALLVSDIATEQMAPLHAADERTDFRALLASQLRSGAVFDAVRPDTIASVARDDPSLARELGPAQIADVWPWHNGPRRVFLVYALELPRLPSASSVVP
jgi:hypothetical protein